MHLRKDYVLSTIQRVFGELAHKDFIILKQLTSVGSLNIVRQQSYTPVIATGEVIFKNEIQQSKAGSLLLGDATVYITKDQFDAYNITYLDRINIGGSIEQGRVQGGQVFTIKEIKYDIIMGTTALVALILEKIQWD